jgi:hypothetical protein
VRPLKIAALAKPKKAARQPIGESSKSNPIYNEKGTDHLHGYAVPWSGSIVFFSAISERGATLLDQCLELGSYFLAGSRLSFKILL